MTGSEMKTRIRSIMFNQKSYGLAVFACVTVENSIVLKRFQANDTLLKQISSTIKPIIENQFLSNETELDIADNIADNRKILYEIIQDKTYAPFGFLENCDETISAYSENEQDSLLGFLFKINLNDDIIWFYQHTYQVRLIKRCKSIYAILADGDTYGLLDRDVLKFDSRIDMLIIENSIITSNISLLQKHFGFEKFIRAEAAKTIALIKSLDLVSNIDRVFSFGDKATLTNAKKLLKAKSSPVLSMEKSDLIRRLQVHPRYKDKFQFVEEKIIIGSQKDVSELIKMLNDDIVRSELTNQEYDSSRKHLLEPIKK